MPEGEVSVVAALLSPRIGEVGASLVREHPGPSAACRAAFDEAPLLLGPEADVAMAAARRR